jgi:DNA helicase-2/ATP-dependent DNA helicase PcrA
MISLTNEQKTAVESDGNVYLSACPGSGKTRVITAKLLALAERQLGTPRSIACITYTNAAVDEIELRLKQVGSSDILDRCEVSTIHSFCLRNVIRPYSWLAPEVPKGFRILTREMVEFEEIVAIVEDEVGRELSGRALDDYMNIGIGMDGEPFGDGIRNGIVTPATARRFWEIMRGRGFLDFSMILFYSLQVLRAAPYIATGISSRFKWILVDEFQDTTEVQIAIFEVLQAAGETSFFLVGDENQSIYGFAGARPDVADEFAINLGAKGGHVLSGNFRSGPQIVDLAETLIARTPPMHSVGKAACYSDGPLYVHVSNPIIAVTDYFLPWVEKRNIQLGRCAVLAPWWTNLIPIARHLRELGVPVVGPGARPYQRGRLFAPLSEQLGACVESGTYSDIPGVERAIFRLIHDSIGASRFDVFSYDGRRTALALAYEAKRTADAVMSGIVWLERCSEASADILIRDGWIPEGKRAILRASVDAMRSDMERRGVDVENLQIADLGIFANPEKAIKLLSFHNSKGREFDAVALVGVNEGRIPHFSSTTAAEFEEARRLFYVGITRAKKLLLIASDQMHHRDMPSRYIGECKLTRPV